MTLEYELQEITADRGPDLTFTGRLVAEFAALRRARGLGAARRLWASRIHRQSRAETLLLYWAAAAGRL